ncbi:MAG: hypothetical protein ACK57U_09645, partial [Planctomycetota bacterium]
IASASDCLCSRLPLLEIARPIGATSLRRKRPAHVRPQRPAPVGWAQLGLPWLGESAEAVKEMRLRSRPESAERAAMTPSSRESLPAGGAAADRFLLSDGFWAV